MPADAATRPGGPPGTAEGAGARLTPQPLAPQCTALPRDPDVARHDIRCDDDRAIPRAYQAHVTQGWPPDDISACPTGHAPSLSAPWRLAATLAHLRATA